MKAASGAGPAVARSAARSAARRAAKPGRSLVWLQGLACGALATLATPLAVLLGALLLPGLCVLMIDRMPGKPVARTMLLCGAAASVSPAWHLWDHGLTMENSLDLLSDVLTVGLAWAATAAGWLIAEVAPICVYLALEATAKRRDGELRAARARHEAEWGIPPAGAEMPEA